MRGCCTYRRSIPAPAGEPLKINGISRAVPVYPRACGGTTDTGPDQSCHPGLSPRLRGNHRAGTNANPGTGSIPAPAGEPGVEITTMTMKTGLSPRLRGNPGGVARDADYQRSIPAPAGEPRSPALPRLPNGVYPRACGGTVVYLPPGGLGEGLSPRLRGNHLRAGDGDDFLGSIPAPAGEPPRPLSSARYSKVYPRACGGTSLPKRTK